MSWIKIILQLILAIPKIIALVQEIMGIINQNKSAAVKTMYFVHLREILKRMRIKGLTAQSLTELHSFHDSLKGLI